MHTPPSVSYPVGSTALLGWTSTVLIVVAAAVTASWTWMAQGLGWQQVLGWVAWAFSSSWLLLAWLRAPEGTFTWDGSSWWFEAADSKAVSGSGSIFARLDLQSDLLLEYCTESGKRLGFFWATRSSEPGRWSDFRRAVFASRSETLPHAFSDHRKTDRAPP